MGSLSLLALLCEYHPDLAGVLNRASLRLGRFGRGQLVTVFWGPCPWADRPLTFIFRANPAMLESR